MDYSLKTNDIPGARPAYRHHSKQIYTLLKKKQPKNSSNNDFDKQAASSNILDSNQVIQSQNLYNYLNKHSSDPQIALSLRKQRVGSFYEESLKNSNFNTQNLMGSWQSAQKRRTGRQFQYSLIQSTEKLRNPEKLQQSFQTPKYSLSRNNMLYNYRKMMDHPPLMPFKDIQKILDYSLGSANKARNKQLAHLQMQKTEKKDKYYNSQIKSAKQSSKNVTKKLSQSVNLADSGLNSLAQLKKNDQQKLFDRKSPYFPHIYRDYDLSGYENKYSGSRQWISQPKSHYNIPSVKGAYIKKF